MATYRFEGEAGEDGLSPVVALLASDPGEPEYIADYGNGAAVHRFENEFQKALYVLSLAYGSYEPEKEFFNGLPDPGDFEPDAWEIDFHTGEGRVAWNLQIYEEASETGLKIVSRWPATDPENTVESLAEFVGLEE